VTTKPITILPVSLDETLKAATEAGLYETVDAFLADSVRTFLAARPDLREAIACRLYERGTFSLGRAAEWSGLSIEQMKEALHRRGISRQAPESPAETEAMARRALEAAGRASV
jgi:hypothetical protein